MSTSPALYSSLPFDLQRKFVEELLSFSSKASCHSEWGRINYSSDSQNEQSHWNKCLSRSDSTQGIFGPQLPGQVPVESPVPPTPQRAMTSSSPVNPSSTEEPTECKLTKRIRSFGKRLWKAIKHPFSCCCSSSVDVVEPFVLPPDLDKEPDPEPSSSVPGHSSVKANDESFESLFNVVKMIGSGGFGRVYEGMRKLDGKKVAIKRMRKIDNECYINIPGHPEPFITEVALLLMMRQEPKSPYAIQLYDWFEHPRKFTLVMEYPEPCENLLDFLIGNPELDEKTAKVIMRQAVLAVQDCIDHGVFHNDIHTQNFLLKKDTLELKLIDFGCGQLFSSDGYESKTFKGVLEYAPPEVYREPRFHAIPTNVWALGVMLFGMLNGCFPFGSVAEAKVTFENPDLSEECRDLISQCLTLDPTKRPTLEQLLQHEWLRNDLL